MAVQRWVVLAADGVPQNVVMWDADDAPDWEPPEGCTVRLDDGTPIELSDAPQQAVQPTADDKLAAASSALAAIDSATTVNNIVAILTELKNALEQ
jgi:hypothetical protein